MLSFTVVGAHAVQLRAYTNNEVRHQIWGSLSLPQWDVVTPSNEYGPIYGPGQSGHRLGWGAGPTGPSAGGASLNEPLHGWTCQMGGNAFPPHQQPSMQPIYDVQFPSLPEPGNWPVIPLNMPMRGNDLTYPPQSPFELPVSTPTYN